MEKRTGFITKSMIANVCLGLIVLLIFFDLPLLCQSHSPPGDDHDIDHDHGHHHHHHHEKPSFKYSREANTEENIITEDHSSHTKKPSGPIDMTSVWIDSILSTLLISAAPFFILYLVPLDNSKERQPFLKILLSFASGGLLGDAFLHLIPHALAPHSHHHEDSHHSHDHEHGHGHDMSVGLAVLGGIVTFLIVEKFVWLVKGGHGHSHDHPSATKETSQTEEKEANGKGTKSKGGSASSKMSTPGSSKKKESTSSLGSDVRVSAYLNLAADFTHNFTDGLAIGASYMAGRSVGIVTTITILFHEIPHEIGDFAILIQAGCSRKKAMFLQLATAFGALTGTVFSLCAQSQVEGGVSWVLPFTAGGFIYVATVTVIPELLVDTKLWQSVKEIAALLFGVYMMVLIASYE